MGATYVTRRRVAPSYWATEGATINYAATGHAKIDVHFTGAGDRIVFFSV